MSLPLDLRFTDPSSPLFIDIETDGSDVLFVISTSLVHGVTDAPAQQNRPVSTVKRRREDQDAVPKPNFRPHRPIKAAQRADAAAIAREMSGIRDDPPRSQSQGPGWMAPPSSHPRPPTQPVREPLFLPGSQSSVVNEEALRGLGIDSMDHDELTQMLEGEGEEVGPVSQRPNDEQFVMHDYQEMVHAAHEPAFDAPDSFELVPDLMATQGESLDYSSKVCRTCNGCLC